MCSYVNCSDTKHMTTNHFFKISEKQTDNDIKTFSQLLNLFKKKLYNMEDIQTSVVFLSSSNFNLKKCHGHGHFSVSGPSKVPIK
jgi:hypothetical protein